jgi:hypothetical protein
VGELLVLLGMERGARSGIEWKILNNAVKGVSELLSNEERTMSQS